MTTVLQADGRLRIPEEIRKNDSLAPGDSFDLKRIGAGQYLLTKGATAQGYRIETGEDGLPVVRGTGPAISLELVRTIEGGLD